VRFPFNNTGLSIIFLSERFFALFILRGGKKSFTVLTSEGGQGSPFMPETVDRKLIRKITGTDIVVIPDIQLLHHGHQKIEEVTISNSIIDDVIKYLEKIGVTHPVIISSIASPEILFHYYSRKLKFFPDDRTYILSGDDDLVFEARLRGRGLAAARLIDFETFKNTASTYTGCDHLISFSADPYSFRFEEEVAAIGHPSHSQGSDESFPLQEGTRDGKTWKGIYNICEMVTELYLAEVLPVPGLLTPPELEKSERNRLAGTAAILNNIAAGALGVALFVFIFFLVRLWILSGAEGELDEFSRKQPQIFHEVASYGGRIPLIPESKSGFRELDSGYVRLTELITLIEEYAENTNIQITAISLKEKNFITVKGYSETPGVASGLVERIKGAQLLSTEIFKSQNEVYTSFRVLIPGDAGWK